MSAAPGTKVHVSLIRTILLLGADRVLVILLYAIVAIYLLALPWTTISVSVSIFLVVVVHPVLIVLCKYEPDWRRIVLRHITYQRYYPPAGHPLAPRPLPRPSIPTAKECR